MEHIHLLHLAAAWSARARGYMAAGPFATPAGVAAGKRALKMGEFWAREHQAATGGRP